MEEHKEIAAVYYLDLESHPQHELARRQMQGFGGMIAFEVVGGCEGATRLLDRVQLCSLAVSLDTLIEHPDSMTHCVLSAEHRAHIGIHDGLVRLSVALEAVEDIIEDLERALSG